MRGDLPDVRSTSTAAPRPSSSSVTRPLRSSSGTGIDPFQIPSHLSMRFGTSTHTKLTVPMELKRLLRGDRPVYPLRGWSNYSTTGGQYSWRGPGIGDLAYQELCPSLEEFEHPKTPLQDAEKRSGGGFESLIRKKNTSSHLKLPLSLAYDP